MSGFDGFENLYYCVVEDGEELEIDHWEHPRSRVLRYPPGRVKDALADVVSSVGHECSIYFFDGTWKLLPEDLCKLRNGTLKLVKPAMEPEPEIHSLTIAELQRYVLSKLPAYFSTDNVKTFEEHMIDGEVAVAFKLEDWQRLGFKIGQGHHLVKLLHPPSGDFATFHQSTFWRGTEPVSIDSDRLENLSGTFFKVSWTSNNFSEDDDRPALLPSPGFIFVRAEYIELLHFVLSRMKEAPSQRIIYIGNPGIGKSLGVLVLLLLFTALDYMVIYHSAEAFQSGYFLFVNGRLEGRIDQQKAYRLLRRKEIIYIHDGSGPAFPYDIRAHTLLITSPYGRVYKVFTKAGAVSFFYGDLWTVDELHQYSELMGLSWNACEDRIFLVGCVPRLVFQPTSSSFNTMLHQMINKVDKKVLDSIGLHDTDSDVSHLLVCLTKGVTRDAGVMQFASRYVQEQVILRLERNLWSSLVMKYESFGNVGVLGSFRGTIFEVAVLSAFPAFLDGCTRLCDHVHDHHFGDANFEHTVGKAEDIQVVFFRDFNDLLVKLAACSLHGVKRAYFWPRRKNEAAVDSIYVDFQTSKAYLLQMTVACRHSTLWQPVRNLVDLLHLLDLEVTGLYFVTSEDNYDNFKYQTWKKSSKKLDGSDYEDLIDGAGLGLCQMKIRFNTSKDTRNVLLDSLCKNVQTALFNAEAPAQSFNTKEEAVTDLNLKLVNEAFDFSGAAVLDETPCDQIDDTEQDASVPVSMLKLDYEVSPMCTPSCTRRGTQFARCSSFQFCKYRLVDDDKTRGELIESRMIGREQYKQLTEVYGWDPLEKVDQLF